MSAANNVPDCEANSLLGALSCGSNAAANAEGNTATTLLAALVAALPSFGIQVAIFLLLRLRLSNIYHPRSYLVPQNERVPAPQPGLIAWIGPLFTTPNLAFIQKCGLDAYFFLRYLRMLLKIFFPAAVIILPILLPINNYSGNQAGLDKLAISNVAEKYTATRLWPHLILAICVILWVLYVIFRELRGYIRVRQAFLTSPQHRIRASATTVLVTGIPRKWLTLEALNGLYDVFPGGIRNIWINRNFDELGDKVDYRNSLAKSLEDAETNLIKMCRKSHEREEERRQKESGKKKTKQDRQQDTESADAAAQILAQGAGTSAGDQHDHPQNLHEAIQEAGDAEDRQHEHDAIKSQRRKRFGLIGDGINVLGQGFETVGKGVGKVGRGIIDDVDAGLQKAVEDVDERNRGKGFVTDDDLYRAPSEFGEGELPPTPPPKTPHEERNARLYSAHNDGPTDRRGAESRPAHAPTQRTVMEVSDSGNSTDVTPTSEKARRPPSIRMTGPSTDSKRLSPFMSADPFAKQQDWHPWWKVWKNSDRSIALPSPRPHTADDDDEFPLTINRTRSNNSATKGPADKKWTEKITFWKSTEKQPETEEESYPDAFNKEWDEDQDGEPYWRRYLEPKERETMRVPIFSPTWCPSLPLIGTKVDRIYYLRRELARMNLEIEIDQANQDKYPYMNSAFIQFNHQVAAHMACQSVSHHIPQHMSPRLVEISPDDVLWSNMSVTWWERYLRTLVVLIIAAGLIILYAIPVTFASLLSKLSTFAQLKPLAWINQIPTSILSAIQGIIGPAFLGIILTLIPIIFRVLVQHQGVPTGTTRELGVQQWYFAFLFIQVFLVVSLTGGIAVLITSIAANPTSIVSALGRELPKASNYFFYYLLVQALATSASNLLQIGSLLGWFVLGPLLDSTARAKWRRQTTLQDVTWGSFFPPFTNFAVIGLVYSVIAPLILVFMLIIFALFWITNRYNVLYVYQFRNDTGGLLFPTAVNQLFVGLYTMELCLIGYFFVARDTNDNAVCIPQAIIMIIALIFTVAFQWLMNSAFSPLFRYLPITLEDEAVIRDEEFARAQAGKFAPLTQPGGVEMERDIQDVLADRGRRESEFEDRAIEREMREIQERRRSHRSNELSAGDKTNASTRRLSPNPQSRDHLSASPTAARSSWHTDRWRKSSAASSIPAIEMARLEKIMRPRAGTTDSKKEKAQKSDPKDVEAQDTVGDVLFSGFANELEDLTPEERDLLVRYAFQHSALRAKRPVVWIPRDRLGVSDDEIRRAKKMSTVHVPRDDGDDEKHSMVEKTNIWMSNEGTALDGKGKVVFRRSPPDFSNVDLIAL